MSKKDDVKEAKKSKEKDVKSKDTKKEDKKVVKKDTSSSKKAPATEATKKTKASEKSSSKKASSEADTTAKKRKVEKDAPAKKTKKAKAAVDDEAPVAGTAANGDKRREAPGAADLVDDFDSFDESKEPKSKTKKAGAKAAFAEALDDDFDEDSSLEQTRPARTATVSGGSSGSRAKPKKKKEVEEKSDSDSADVSPEPVVLKERQRESDREKERKGKAKEKDRDRDRSKSRSRSRSRSRSDDRDRDREKAKDRDSGGIKLKEREKEKDRRKDRDSVDRRKDRDSDRGRDREKDRGRRREDSDSEDSYDEKSGSGSDSRDSSASERRRRRREDAGLKPASGFGLAPPPPDPGSDAAAVQGPAMIGQGALALPEKVQGLLMHSDTLAQEVLRMKIAVEAATGAPQAPLSSGSGGIKLQADKSDAAETVLKMQSRLAESLLDPSNEPKLLAKTGLLSAHLNEEKHVVLRAPSRKALQKALGQLKRVAYHCQWGCSVTKVNALLSERPAKPINTMVLRLAATSSRLLSHEERLTLKNRKLRIGSQAGECQLVVEGIQGVSRKHCTVTLEPEKGACYVQDLSTNGTYLNGKRLPRPPYKNPSDARLRLFHGDELLFKTRSEDGEELGFVVNLLELS
eukprot:TRINITY_DN18354_c0_g2_i4.p1 TRINITY_DN18354_c0_g2~~TRINITY_DN18354_c0_g2_i4.p1  ORF type:complete len:632 (-),score=175.09 TRINITY_DN18354_c0_g2_i4:192-2087(-)